MRISVCVWLRCDDVGMVLNVCVCSIIHCVHTSHPLYSNAHFRLKYSSTSTHSHWTTIHTTNCIAVVIDIDIVLRTDSLYVVGVPWGNRWRLETRCFHFQIGKIRNTQRPNIHYNMLKVTKPAWKWQGVNYFRISINKLQFLGRVFITFFYFLFVFAHLRTIAAQAIISRGFVWKNWPWWLIIYEWFPFLVYVPYRQWINESPSTFFALGFYTETPKSLTLRNFCVRSDKSSE